MADSEREGFVEEVLEEVDNVYDWITTRLERTWFMGLRFSLPKQFPNPMTFFGMLTFVCFLILGVTGIVLLWYYNPAYLPSAPSGEVVNATENAAFTSVAFIDEEAPFGYVLRNIHYHTSNAMVFMAVAHLFYQYFKGRYKLRYEMLWVTGMIFGVLTVLAAFTGYNLILNTRARLAINIGQMLTFLSPPPELGATLFDVLFNVGTDQLVRTFYALHIWVLPAVMILIGIFHLPTDLVLDIPSVSALVGGILLVAGFFPIELGQRWIIGLILPVEIPEWYFTSLYAFLRADFLIDSFGFFYSAFILGGILPAILILVFLIPPFLDTQRGLRFENRPFWASLGLAALFQIILTTVWGFFGCLKLPDQPIECATPGIEMPLFFFDRRVLKGLSPAGGITGFLSANFTGILFWSLLVIVSAAAFVYVYKYFIKMERDRSRPEEKPFYLTGNWLSITLFALLGLQVFLNGTALLAFLGGMRQLVMVELGMIIVIFGLIYHAYRTIRNVEGT